MSLSPLDCAAIRHSLSVGQVPDGPAVREHAERCEACRELLAGDALVGRYLALGSEPVAAPSRLLADIEAGLGREVGARARLRALPTPARAVGLLTAVGGLLLASHLLLGPRSDLGEYSPPLFWGAMALLGLAVAFGSFRVVRGPSTPLDSAKRDGSVARVLLLLPAAVALLAPLGASSAARAGSSWGSSLECFTYGVVVVTPIVFISWLFERRERVPLVTTLVTGGLSGVAANLLLHAHCASAHLGHLLLGHASVGAVWALALATLSVKLARAR